MPKIRNPRLSQAHWADHKDTIKRLYLKENKNLGGENGVIQLMKQQGLSASKPQYESQFKRWGFKKKLTREAWHTIGHLIERRKHSGLTSHVYVYGVRLQPEKVKKEIGRYKLCGAEGHNCAKKELPDGIQILQEFAQSEETTPIPESEIFCSNALDVVDDNSAAESERSLYRVGSDQNDPFRT
ncbi:hypothetical protein AG0111_0g4193 [Alternaria gaisen]|uniref:Uncharacterized protein n=1 Tax=Alternaria gaisen TaxID=167740 RepID=A0ACB6FU45_9PLEO|nr:hypothetical protein AG0111_0g4193 [Alternaria gaisen]